MKISCVLATVFGLLTTVLAGYLGWVIFKLGTSSSLLVGIGVAMSAVGAAGVVAARKNAQDLKATQSTMMFFYIYGVVLLIPILLLVVVGCFSFDSTLTR